MANTLTLQTADGSSISVRNQAGVLTGATVAIVDLLGTSFSTVRLPDEPNYAATLRVRQNAPIGSHQGILSYAERTSTTLHFNVRCLGNAGVPSINSARANRDAIRSLLGAGTDYWTSPNHSSGAQVVVTYLFGDMADADTWTAFRGELREQHGIDAAVGYMTLDLKIFAWEGTVT